VTPAEIDEGVEIFEQALREAPEDEPPP
jgi:hypothetical protein